MFRFIKQVLIALLIFNESLTTKYVSLNNETCMARPTLIDLNPVELNYYPFLISLDKCNKVVILLITYLLLKYVFRSKTKDVNVKVLLQQ